MGGSGKPAAGGSAKGADVDHFLFGSAGDCFAMLSCSYLHFFFIVQASQFSTEQHIRELAQTHHFSLEKSGKQYTD